MPNLSRVPSTPDDDPPSREDVAIEPALVSSERVIVFARYPEPGQVKTRLIPALGAEGSSQLQTALTRSTLDVVQRFRSVRSCDSEVRFAGGDVSRMRTTYGDAHRYSLQKGDDLGERLEHAVLEAFEQGTKRLLVIGTDCPQIEPCILEAAFDSLFQVDVVLGPAIDGGYYLIGLRANRPEHFRGIDWGTERVLRQTLESAERLRCSVHQLNVLSDIDNPEDLTRCRQALESFMEVLPDELVRWFSLITK